jgi:SAM-dependent methyltransferase
MAAAVEGSMPWAEGLVGAHAAGSARLVLALQKARVGVGEPLRFSIALENDMGHALGPVALSLVVLAACDEAGPLQFEAAGARPGLPHAARFERPTVGLARLSAAPAADAVGLLRVAIGASSVPFVVARDSGAARRGEGAASDASARGRSCRALEIGGALAGRPIKLYESREGVHSQLWDSGLALARFLAKTPPAAWLGESEPSDWLARAELAPSAAEPLRGLRVLELGAGVGATALALGALGATVVATDAAAGSVELLRANAAANGLDGERLAAEQLEWGCDDAPLRARYDLVVGADVVYVEDCFAPLVGTLRACVARGAVGLLAYRRRCEPGVEAHFFHLLRAALAVEPVVGADVGLGVQLYRLGALRERAADISEPVCQYCAFLKARWARQYIAARAPLVSGSETASGWSPKDLLL